MSIPAVKTFGDREVCQANAAGRREYLKRLGDMQVRQDGLCAICGKWLGASAVLDHQDGRGSGGGRRDDRIEIDGEWYNAALCWDCNGRKGSVRYAWVDGKFVPAT